ncbi:MAG: glycosyltransferase family A protein [Dehalococcoidia bacterium]|nr:glycosyltransferase family A protein [Dehalococcoidia bacterium]
MSISIDVGILTRGKATLGIALTSLLLQEMADIRITIVDTGDSPVIKREDVRFALKLAADMRIACEYRHIRENDLAFSLGRLKVLEHCTGSHVCFMDDDVALPSTALRRIAGWIEQNGVYGYVAPHCHNANPLARRLLGPQHFTPGSVFYQDAPVRQALLEYYGSTVDVLDRKGNGDKVWEIAFLSQLFPSLGRRCEVQEDNAVCHVDYGERPNWNLLDRSHVQASLLKARQMARRFAAAQPEVNTSLV